MSNMSYCRFENTVKDVQDASDNMYLDEDASDEEKEARDEFIELCVNIALEYGDNIGRPVEEI